MKEVNIYTMGKVAPSSHEELLLTCEDLLCDENTFREILQVFPMIAIESDRNASEASITRHIDTIAHEFSDWLTDETILPSQHSVV